MHTVSSSKEDSTPRCIEACHGEGVGGATERHHWRNLAQSKMITEDGGKAASMRVLGSLGMRFCYYK